jgi:hypothetical protein
MAQHDYVIANGTGAAVRSDLNNALAAIVSQNSGASAPATTYAYQWWADTSTNLLKLRNGANSSFITVGDLTATNLGLAALASPTFTGTVTIPTATISTGAGIPLASAASPAIYFTGDTNTGIYSPGADQFAITTGGSGRVFVDSSGRVGLGTSAPAGKAMILGSDTTSFGTITNGALNLGTTNGTTNGRYVNLNFGYDTGATNAPASIGFTYTAQTGTGAGSLQFGTRSVTTDTAPDVRMTITSAGNVGIGTTGPSQALEVNGSIRLNNDLLYADATATRGRIYADSTGLVVRADTGLALRFHADAGEKARIDTSGRLLVGTSTSPSAGEGQYARIVAQGNTSSATGGAYVSLQRGEAATAITAEEELGLINFGDSAGNTFGTIACRADATAGSGDYPGRLSFSVTQDGSASPTERLRLENRGIVYGYSADAGYIQGLSNGSGTTYRFFAGRHTATGADGTGTETYRVYSNGNVQNTNGSYTAISDQKLKENIADASSQWNDLKAIQIRNWNFKSETGYETHRQIGPIAQELELVCPGLVFETPDQDDKGNDLGTTTKGVNQSVLYMKAVKALQEAMERIEALEAEVAALKGA